MKKRIGILGSGIVGKTLAEAFHSEGYDVKIGSRNPEKLSDWLKGKTIHADQMDRVAEFGEILILAVKGNQALKALESIGESKLNAKVLIDATNPISDEAPINGVLNFFTEQNSSLMEELQSAFPNVYFVKAFNSIGAAHMYKPQFNEKPTMFICGDQEKARSTVSEILSSFGWDVEDMGSARSAGAIEALCMLWCIKGFSQNSWNHAFHLLNK